MADKIRKRPGNNHLFVMDTSAAPSTSTPLSHRERLNDIDEMETLPAPFKNENEDEDDDENHIQLSVHQGAVLSPALFNYFISDFPQLESDKTLFADNIFTYSHPTPRSPPQSSV